MCAICGGAGYRQPTRYGVGSNTGNVLWANYVVMEPCQCRIWRWSPTPPHWPQPIVFPLNQKPPPEDDPKRR